MDKTFTRDIRDRHVLRGQGPGNKFYYRPGLPRLNTVFSRNLLVSGSFKGIEVLTSLKRGFNSFSSSFPLKKECITVHVVFISSFNEI